jgi:rhamnosyltransferase
MRQLLAIVVCFDPVLSNLHSLTNIVHSEGVPIVWINNGPAFSLDATRHPGVLQVIEMERNMGVATALNAGFQWALQNGFEAVISFDQDSLPLAGMVGKLQQRFAQAASEKLTIAAIGPTTIDQQSGHAMLSFEPYNWQRKRFLPSQAKAYVVDHLITSGCLIPCRVWLEVGPLNEGLFIDWVDIEWCARARLQGFTLLLDGGTQMNHSIGEASRTILWRRFHLHTPLRHFYLLRNAVFIAKKSQFELGWRVHLLLYAARVIAASLVFGDQRLSRLSFAFQGLVAGIRGRQGRIDEN